jgi:ABC-type multidrug transport system ATPase subunit
MLSLSGVTHVYADGTRALDEVSLVIPTGLFGLLGPNGAGKTTLMRAIATLQTPTGGRICFGDIDVIREPHRLRAALGYLPQEFGVYPRVSAYALLDHLAVLKGFSRAGERREMLEHLLAQANLWSVRKRPVASFSGGMRQRFGIAQALIGSPSLIIVDEPTAGLDPEERSRFNDLLAEIGERIVVVLSTHIVDDVSDLCSRMAIIHEGRIIAEGVPQELTGRLQGRVWRSTVRKEALPDLSTRFTVIRSRLHAGRTVVHVLAERTPAAEFEPVETHLEDLYFATLSQARSRPAARGEKSTC